MTYQVDNLQMIIFFDSVITNHLEEDELKWISQKKEKIEGNLNLSSFYIAFSTASRSIRKKPLLLSGQELEQANDLRNGFYPENWDQLHWVRSYFLLILANHKREAYENGLIKLFETATMEEQVSLYGTLPILPYPNFLVKLAIEGIRTNITTVFDAIALNNPFPTEFLPQAAWNQMVLKAVFMQRPLYRIYNADERANSDLSRMLIDFAHERWAAHRWVSPELWRFVAPFMDDNSFSDIEKTVNTGASLEKKAALLACASSNNKKADKLLAQYPEIRKDIDAGRITWTRIGQQQENKIKS
jgi:hypothetical protein